MTALRRPADPDPSGLSAPAGATPLFWVVGGEFQDTRFQSLAAGAALETYGPFAHLAEALQVWSHHAWQTVDDCNRRYVVLRGGATPPEGPVHDLIARAVHDIHPDEAGLG